MDITRTFEIFATIVVAVFGSNGLWAYIQSRRTSRTAQDRMLLGLGHAEIYRQCEKYLNRKGITTDELDDLDKYLYLPYAELGGNGTGETLVQQCKSLPIITAWEAAQLDKEMGLL